MTVLVVIIVILVAACAWLVWRVWARQQQDDEAARAWGRQKAREAAELERAAQEHKEAVDRIMLDRDEALKAVERADVDEFNADLRRLRGES